MTHVSGGQGLLSVSGGQGRLSPQRVGNDHTGQKAIRTRGPCGDSAESGCSHGPPVSIPQAQDPGGHTLHPKVHGAGWGHQVALAFLGADVSWADGLQRTHSCPVGGLPGPQHMDAEQRLEWLESEGHNQLRLQWLPSRPSRRAHNLKCIFQAMICKPCAQNLQT